MKKNIIAALIFFICMPVFCAPWTFMAYIMASPDMEEEMARNLHALSTVGSNQNVEIYALVDWTQTTPGSSKKAYIPNPSYTGVARYHIEKNRIVELQQLGEADMGDENVFWNFLDSCTENGVTHGMLLFGGHGSGFESWQEIPKTSDKCIAYDDKENNSLTLKELETVLLKFREKNRGPMTFTLFDSCLMMNLPVLYQLRKCTDYMVGSDSGLFLGNGRYEKLVSTISKNPSPNMSVLCKEIVYAFAQDISSSTAGSVTSCFSAPRSAMLKDYATWLADEMVKSGFNQAGAGVEMFGHPPRYIDIGELCEAITKTGKLPDGNPVSRSLQSIAEGFVSTVEDSRLGFDINGIYHTRNLCGLSLWLPSKEEYNKSREYFKTTKFGSESSWYKFLDWKHGI